MQDFGERPTPFANKSDTEAWHCQQPQQSFVFHYPLIPPWGKTHLPNPSTVQDSVEAAWMLNSVQAKHLLSGLF